MVQNKIFREVILTKNRELRRFGIIFQVISFVFLFGKHVLWFRVTRDATRKWLGLLRDKKGKASKKGWDRLRDFSMVRGFGSLLQCRCMHIERYRPPKRNEPFWQIERWRGSLFRFNYHNYICSIVGLWVTAPISIRRNRIRYLQMWLPPRRFTTSTRRNGCLGSILFLAFCN